MWEEYTYAKGFLSTVSRLEFHRLGIVVADEPAIAAGAECGYGPSVDDFFCTTTGEVFILFVELSRCCKEGL